MMWLVLALTAQAATVDLHVQARLLDSGGAPLNGSVSLEVYLCDDASGGTCALASQLGNVSLADGYVSADVPVDTDDLAAGDLWVEFRTDGSALSPRSKLSTVPHAGVAVRAGVADLATHLPVDGPPASASCIDEGSVAFDTARRTLRVCHAGQWSYMDSVDIVDGGTGRRWSDGTVAASCDAYRNPSNDYEYAGATGDGLYRIDPDGSGPVAEHITYCDMQTAEGWTLLIVANGDSTTFGNGTNETASKWRSNDVIGAATDPIADADFRSQAYGSLQTDSIRLCYQDTAHCFDFDHGQGRTLQSFFTGNATYVAYASNSYTHPNTGSDSIRTSYLAALGLTAIAKPCYWLGIHDRNSYSAIGLLGDNSGGCVGNTSHHDDLAIGVGVHSCNDANSCTRGGSGHKAGQARGEGTTDSNTVLGPWLVFGR